MDCKTCTFYVYDEDYEEYICTANVDEDDYVRLMQGGYRQCPFWGSGKCAGRACHVVAHK